mmetsp:Transcript_29416/g.85374  ORF Transcript_29416/g.85374 Transcript_29416/m.85374 type:complete len:398 (-) Transcript_29416:139-1332(-)
MIALPDRVQRAAPEPAQHGGVVHRFHLSGREEVRPSLPRAKQAPTDPLQRGDSGLRRKAIRALVAGQAALRPATCRRPLCIAGVGVRHVRDIPQKPHVEHDQAPRHLRRGEGLVQALPGARRVLQAAKVRVGLQQPQNVSVEDLLEQGHCDVIPSASVGRGQQAEKLAQVRHLGLGPVAVAADEIADAGLDQAAKLRAAAFQLEQQVVEGHVAGEHLLRRVHLALHEEDDLRVHQLREHSEHVSGPNGRCQCGGDFDWLLRRCGDLRRSAFAGLCLSDVAEAIPLVQGDGLRGGRATARRPCGLRHLPGGEGVEGGSQPRPAAAEVRVVDRQRQPIGEVLLPHAVAHAQGPARLPRQRVELADEVAPAAFVHHGDANAKHSVALVERRPCVEATQRR